MSEFPTLLIDIHGVLLPQAVVKQSRVWSHHRMHWPSGRRSAEILDLMADPDIRQAKWEERHEYAEIFATRIRDVSGRYRPAALTRIRRMLALYEGRVGYITGGHEDCVMREMRAYTDFDFKPLVGRRLYQEPDRPDTWLLRKAADRIGGDSFVVFDDEWWSTDKDLPLVEVVPTESIEGLSRNLQTIINREMRKMRRTARVPA